MTAPARWCPEHQRYECASLRRYRTVWCHSLPMKGAGKCQAHTSRAPATGARELAHQQVSVALADSLLIRPEACELCAASRGDSPSWAIHAHHEDYARPLDVIWLCVTCHNRVHTMHGGLAAYVDWLRVQLAAAERLHERFYAIA